MKRALALIAIALSLGGCAHVRRAGPLRLGAADSGRTVQLAVGQTLTLALAADLSTGHAWQVVTPPDARMLIVVDSGYGVPPGSAPGAAEQAWWVCRATGGGATSMELRYGRPWESAPDAQQQYTLSVTVK